VTGEPQEPTPGAGLRHAIVLAIAGVLPLAYALTAAGRDGFEGFSQVLVLGVTLVITVAAALVSVAFPVPSKAEILARIAILVLIALGIRFTVPTPGLALDEIRSDDGRLFSGAFLLALALLAIGFAVGHSVARGVEHLATPARTVRIARDRERRALVVWWWTMLLHVFVVGVTPSGGVAASIVLAVCALVSLILLADLRLRTAPPAATRPPIVAAPRRVRAAGVVFAVVAVVSLTAVLTPLGPLESLRTVPSVPTWLPEWGFGEPPAPESLDGLLGEQEEVEPREERMPPPEREWSVPTPPWQLVAALAALGVLALLRPHRWRRGLRRLLAIIRLSRWLGDDTAVGEVTDLEELEDEAERRQRGRVARVLDRIRPRPRDPRAAVLYDYFHVERVLAKQQQGREGHETPHEHAVRVHVSEAHEELADLAADARFARTAPDAPTIARARDLRREIEQALKADGG
jgi:hypothetical protein